MKPQHVKQATPQVEVTHIPSIDPLLRLPDVEAATGFKRSHIYALMARGDFPKTVRIGTNAVAWRQSDIAAWFLGWAEVHPDGEVYNITREGDDIAVRLILRHPRV